MWPIFETWNWDRVEKLIQNSSAQPCLVLKLLSNKVGSLLCFWNAPKKYRRLDTKLETKMVELKRSSSGQSKFRSINSIILKFPHFKEGLKEIKGVFEQFDEDSNGTIDRDELKKCVKKLHFHVKDEEVNDLFDSCDVDEKEGIQFNEFIVLLCLLYLLIDSSSSSDNFLFCYYLLCLLLTVVSCISVTAFTGLLWTVERSIGNSLSTFEVGTSKIGSPELEATFNTIVEAFLFLDKNGDGKLHKKDVLKALNDECPCEKSPSHVTRTRFREMDWNRSGKVSFRQFLFAFLDWVGIDTDDENHTTKRETKCNNHTSTKLVDSAV
ncbi:hypothetical protein MTR67_041656 [Solanum verrucosum]|uniref:EF-hand domain-containing protein n=1 Tax=Solanum verrucosum TaxID=315347 RepID=A0AAF0ZQZ8_SOLVR|nr:hypothetical protein MTR67_041656 [Solanum verrucosum]